MDILAYAIIGKESKENTETGAGPYTTDMAESMAEVMPNNPVLMVSQAKKGQKGGTTVNGNLTKVVLEYNPSPKVLSYELKNVVFDFKNKLGEGARLAVECADYGGNGAKLIEEVNALKIKDITTGVFYHNNMHSQRSDEEREAALKDPAKREVYEMEKASLEDADFHMGPTTYIRNHQRNVFPGNDNKKYIRIPNPINGNDYNSDIPHDAASKPLKVNDTVISYDTFNIGVVGRGEKLKGVENAAKVMNTIAEKYPNAHMYNIGKYYTEADNKPVTEASLKTMLNDKAAERTHFVGMVDNKDMPAVFKTLDCHLFLSEYDNFSGVVLQAALSGVPTVARNRGGNTELVATDKGPGAYIIEADSDENVVEEAAKIIGDIIDNPKPAKALTANFAQNIRDKLNRQNIAKIKWATFDYASRIKQNNLDM